MTRHRFTHIVIALALLLCFWSWSVPTASLAQPPESNKDSFSPTSEWKDLFDGQTLSGWVQRGGKAKFSIDEESILGSTVRGEATSYLCTEADYQDFELILEFRLDDIRLNSGVQIRSQSLPEYRNGMVHGYQVEIDPSERAWTGGIYDEGRRGWLLKLDRNPEARRAFRLGSWNTLRIVCLADWLRTWVNEIPASDLRDNVTASGFIALQLHSTSETQEMRIRWRNLKIRTISAPQ